VVDPHLHADDAERGLRLGLGVVDLGPQRVQRDAALAVPLAPRHLGPAEPAAALHPNTQRAGLHGGLDRSAHGPAEADPAHQLLGGALGQQRGVGLGLQVRGGLVHVLDLHVHPLAGDLLDVLADAVDLGALAPDDDAGAGRADEHLDLVALAFDVDARDAGPNELGLDVHADLDVLVQGFRIVLAPVPLGLPGVDDAQAEPVGVDLVTHR